jgi:hypothetical protein
MLTGTEKGERLDGGMHSINLFSDAYTRQIEALTQKSPFRRFIQSTHTDLTFLKKGSRSESAGDGINSCWVLLSSAETEIYPLLSGPESVQAL